MIRVWKKRTTPLLTIVLFSRTKRPSSPSHPHETSDKLNHSYKDRRTLARETTNRSIWRSLSPCTGSGRRPFRESDPNRARWWRRVSALLNRLNDLDVTPFPVTRQLYPAANKSLLLSPSPSPLLYLSLPSPLPPGAFVLPRHEYPSTCHC